MANDAADFSVRLHDELTGPARSMRTELKGLQNDLKRFGSGADRSLGRMKVNSGPRGIKGPPMLSANDRSRAAERDASLEDRAIKQQQREAAKLRSMMARDEKAKLAAIARQDKAYLQAARNQQRAQERVERDRQRAAKRVISEDRSRAAYLAHKKVLSGGVGGEVLAGLGAVRGGGIGGIASSVSSLVGKGGLGALAAGGAIAIGVIAVGQGVLAIKDAAIAAATGVATLAANFAAASVDAYRFSQSSQFAIKNLTHGTSDAGAEFNDVRKMAEDLGLGVRDTVTSFKELLGAQFEIGRAKELLKMSADLRSVGADAMQVQGAIRAITQIKGQGRLMGQELLQLANAGISVEQIRKEIQKLKGLGSLEEVIDLQAAGKIDSETAIQGILNAVKKETNSKEAGDAGRNFADATLDGMLGRLNAGLENLFVDAGAKLGPIAQQMMGKVVQAFDVLRNHEGLQTLGVMVVDRLQRVADWVERNWPTIESMLVKGLDAVTDAGTALIAVGDFVVDHWGEIEPLLTVVGIAAGVAAFNVGILATGFAAAVAPIVAFWGVVSKAIQALERLTDLAKNLGPKHLAKRFGIDLGPGNNLDDQPRQKTPELIAEEKMLARREATDLSIGALKVGAANDNARGTAAGARAGNPFLPKREAPPQQQRIAAVGNPFMQPKSPPLTNPTQAAAASGSREMSEAARVQLEAAKISLEAAQTQKSAAARGGGRGGMGESDMIGMLEAV